MPATLAAAPGLYTWTLTLENGSTRLVVNSSLAAALGAAMPSPVVKAERGPAFDLSGESVTPTVGSLNPASAKIGDPTFTLHVIGTGFRAGCSIVWNGGVEATTLVSPTELTTVVNMETATTPTPIPVSVRTVAGLESAAKTFDLQPAAGAEAEAAQQPAGGE